MLGWHGDSDRHSRAAPQHGQRRHGRARIGKRVLEVRGESVVLECRQRPNLTLQKFHVGQRPTRPVIRNPAMRHRRPVSNRWSQQHSVLPRSANQLFDGLSTIEHTSRRLRDHRKSTCANRNDDVAFIVHRRAERQVCALQMQLGGGRRCPLEVDNEIATTRHKLLSTDCCDLPEIFGGEIILFVLPV